MATEIILLIPKLGKGGGTLREKLSGFSFGSITPRNTVTRPVGDLPLGMKGEITVTLPLNENSSMFVAKVVSGEMIPEARVEGNEITKTTLKNNIVYDFTNLQPNSFATSGTSDPSDGEMIAVTLAYGSVKWTYNK